MTPIILKEVDETSVIKKLCELIEKKSNAAIDARGVFRVGLSGDTNLTLLFDLIIHNVVLF